MSKLNLKYYPSEQLIKVKTNGSVGTKDFIDAIDDLPKYLTRHSRLNVLIDLTDTDITSTTKEVRFISDSLQKKIPKHCLIRIAKIVNGSKETALAMLFRNGIKNNTNIIIAIFCTKSASVKWIKSKLN